MSRFRKPTNSESIGHAEANRNGFPLWRPSAGQRPALAADVWGLLTQLIAEEAQKSGNERPARALLEQAEDFYFATGGTHFSARPLLYYYSFMNLVKAFLIGRGASPTPRWTHGLTHVHPAVVSPSWTTQKLSVEHRAQRNPIFRRFVRELAPVARIFQSYEVEDLVEQIVGVHANWQDARNARASFVHATFELRKTSRPSDALAVITVHDTSRRSNEIMKSVAGVAGLQRTTSIEGFVRYETRRDRVRRGRGGGFAASVARLAGEIRVAGVHAILTHQGYRYYLSDLRHPTRRLPQLAAIYAVMFYLASITRYRPYDFDRYLSSRSGPLLREFLATQPAQFLFLVASEVANNEVVVPFGTIDVAATR